MPFDQSSIIEVYPPQIRGGQVYLSWASSAPPGTWFQVYVNQQLAWFGQRLWTWVGIPSGPVRIDIGSVSSGSELTSFVGSLPPSPTRRAQLSWSGGTFQGADLAGFHVYGSDVPGGPIDYTTVLADITAYPAGITTDGFGLGGFGRGGLGQAASSYAWTSSPLAGGYWQFAVRSYDTAGNEGAANTTAVTIDAPPREPAPFPGTTMRLEYTLNGWGQVQWGNGGWGLPTASLTWNPSPT